MAQTLAFWTKLDTRRRVIVALAALAVFAAVLGLSRLASGPNMALLYSGLDSRQAGEVIAALDQRGVQYSVRGSAIFVDQPLRDELRMALAGEGLPANTGAGYELLDQLSGFGTTSQMFDAAYWRAKEGELARTIVAGRSIRYARVHISNQAATPFQRDLTPTASVSVTPTAEPISTERAQALRFLVASAVAGLDPANVSVIDASTGRVLDTAAQRDPASMGGDRAEQLKANVERLLEARVGPGNAIVEVSVETVTDRESIVERRFDPESRVAISTDTEERTQSTRDSGSPSVTVASNLPTGDAQAGRDAQSQESELRERTNFEVSETQREIVRPAGAIKRLTVAVLVNDTGRGAEGGSGRDETELEALRALVASAVGFDEARGDVITLRALAFEPAPELGSGPTLGLVERYGLDAMKLVQLGVLALVSLALGLFVVRPILAGSAASDAEALALPAGSEATQAVPAIPAVQTGSDGGLPVPANTPGGLETTLPAMAVMEDAAAAAAGTGALARGDDPVVQLRQLIEDRQPDTIEILKSWLEDDSTAETV